MEDPLAKDQPILFGVWTHLEALGGWIAGEEVGIFDRNVTAFT